MCSWKGFGFRYMALLLEGGIYTDSDTAPVIPADQWGLPYQNGSDPLLSHFSRILALPSVSSSLDDKVTQAAGFADGGELDPPSLVISIESDAIDFGWYNWRDIGLIRALQIVQWTIMVSLRFPLSSAKGPKGMLIPECLATRLDQATPSSSTQSAERCGKQRNLRNLTTRRKNVDNHSLQRPHSVC